MVFRLSTNWFETCSVALAVLIYRVQYPVENIPILLRRVDLTRWRSDWCHTRMSSIYNNGYSFFLRIKAFNSENTFHIILYYTDDIAICLNRAAERHTAGLHLVSPDTIAEMYRNTISLLMANFKIADEITFYRRQDF